jgi:hypothetical protein
VKEKKPCRPKRRAPVTEPATASTHTADRDVAVGLRPSGPSPRSAERTVSFQVTLGRSAMRRSPNHEKTKRALTYSWTATAMGR